LMRSIDRDLSVVACNHTGLGRLDAAIRIGEVALRAIGRPAVGPAGRRSEIVAGTGECPRGAAAASCQGAVARSSAMSGILRRQSH
jgi:hypothetical protein